MFVPYFTRPGKKAVASVQGSVWKFVSCEHCPQRYAYLLELEATGEDLALLCADGSAELALAKAQENLSQKKQRCLLPVPCPCCGHYQAEMSRLLKEEASINLFQIGGALIAALGIIPLAFDIASNWVITLVIGVAGVCLMAYGYYLSFRFDPDAGSGRDDGRHILHERPTRNHVFPRFVRSGYWPRPPQYWVQRSGIR